MLLDLGLGIPYSCARAQVNSMWWSLNITTKASSRSSIWVLQDGVNITLGLPFVRTSPDHGTAFDIAAKGGADHASLRAAYLCAMQLIEHQT